MEPDLFSNGGGFAEPAFEVVVRNLPILPDSRSGLNGAGFGAEIIDI